MCKKKPFLPALALFALPFRLPLLPASAALVCICALLGHPPLHCSRRLSLPDDWPPCPSAVSLFVGSDMASLRTSRCFRPTKRGFSTSSAALSARRPVELAHDHYPAVASSSSSGKGPLVILHGLFGSKQNWRSLAKSLAQRTSRDVYTLVRLRITFALGQDPV